MPATEIVTPLRRTLTAGVRDVVLGQSCAGCGLGGEVLCGPCSEPLGSRGHPVEPTPSPPGLPRVWAITSYDGAVRAAINAFKEHGRLGLARPLGGALGEAVRAAIEHDRAGQSGERFTLVGVPSARGAVRRRGHDATQRLAQVAAACLREQGVDVVVAPVLELRRRVADQAGLSAEQRGHNLAGAFRATTGRRKPFGGRQIVLIDDVMTTGSTLVEARRAVEAAGVVAARAAVIAATRRRAVVTRSAGDRLA